MTKRTKSPWGRPIVAEVKRDAFKRPIVETPPRKNPWGRPVTEAKTNPWGREIRETARNAWGREVEPKPKAGVQNWTPEPNAPALTDTPPRATKAPPAVVRPAAKSTIVQEGHSDPLAPWSADRLLDLAPGSRIAVVRRTGGRWAPAYGYATG